MSDGTLKLNVSHRNIDKEYGGAKAPILIRIIRCAVLEQVADCEYNVASAFMMFKKTIGG
jgi:hypothetical protein